MISERRGGIGTMILDTVAWKLNDCTYHL